MPRSATLLLVLLSTALRAQQGEFLVRPRAVDWDVARREVVDPDMTLPWPARDDPRCLRGRFERLLARRWATTEDDVFCRTFGDLVAAFVALRDRPRAVALLLERLEDRRPDVWNEVGDLLPDLVRDGGVRGPTWDPETERWDDGFHFGAPLTLGSSPMPSWRRVEGSQTVQQAATLIVADLDAIERAENDYRAYRDHVGAAYLSIFPVPGSHLRGVRDGAPFAGLRLFFESDLPFPFTSYECDLRIQKHLDDAGRLVTDTWSDSRDFLWIAGSNVYLPVRDASGRFVAMLAVRIFGFDLRGVPDGDGNRRSGLRSVLGNLKRGAEAVFAGRDPSRGLVLEGAIPEVPVLGRR